MVHFRKEGTPFRSGINITRSVYATYVYWAWPSRIWLRPLWRLHSIKTGVVPRWLLRIPKHGCYQECRANYRVQISHLVHS